MRKKNNILIICIISSILLLLFDFFKFDIFIKANYSFGLLIVVGLLSYIPYLIYGVWTIGVVFYSLSKIKVKQWSFITSLAIVAITILLIMVIPYTETYSNLNYSFNRKNLHRTIEMVINEETQLHQTGSTEYLVPYRLTSYTGQFYTYENEDITKIMFYVYHGFRGSRVLIYSSDGSMIENEDFYKRFKEIKKIDDKWYSARIYF